jgi:hypothetical protein
LAICHTPLKKFWQLPIFDLMKAADSFSELKKETVSLLLSLQDVVLLGKVRALLLQAPTPQRDLDDIDRSIALCEAGGAIPADEFLKELELM